jgi:hypothetical protein
MCMDIDPPNVDDDRPSAIDHAPICRSPKSSRCPVVGVSYCDVDVCPGIGGVDPLPVS